MLVKAVTVIIPVLFQSVLVYVLQPQILVRIGFKVVVGRGVILRLTLAHRNYSAA